MRLHPAWAVAAVAFLALVGAAGFRAAPGALMVPLQEEFGWSTSVLSLAVSINLLLFGLTAPFAAALMDRFGIRQVVACALTLVALGAGGSVLMTSTWQLLLFWGVLIGIHFIPSAHDHGMSGTTAAGLLAAVGVFDIVGTISSGWLTDTYDPRVLLACYYVVRGLSLLALPTLLAATVHPSMLLFVVSYGLDWLATVPPTVALCRATFGERGTIVFGWLFASHQLGAAAAALGAGVVRDTFGAYTYAWWGGAVLCALAAVLSFGVRTTSTSDDLQGARDAT